MGVPKFFRWISERYPRVNQRYGRVPEPERIAQHFGKDYRGEAEALAPPDPLSTCATPPPIDRLYIDMNGIIHGCSHNNNDGDDDSEGVAQITEAEIFRNVCYYLDRVVSELAHPNALVYMAVDGVAPRAKLNQQRSRRYRSGKEGLIEQTIYEAHVKNQHGEIVMTSPHHNIPPDTVEAPTEINDGVSTEETKSDFEEVQPGRFAGKLLAHLDQDSDPAMHDLFHSNNITPGTPFFTRCTAAIQHFVQKKVSEDPDWKHLTVIFSGSNVPGEGEHKIMQFIREQRAAYERDQNNKASKKKRKKNGPKHFQEYHPNLRHCIMGQDGDLIMLGLATHEPNLVLLREQVLFDARRRAKAEDLAASIDSYLFNPNFEFLHMNVLRDYLAYEFETSNVIEGSPWDVEHSIDDFVLMTFFCGNDFICAPPAIDIADEAFDLLFYTYRNQRQKWKKDKEHDLPYLTNRGSIVSGRRLEDFLQAVGKHETMYFQFKKSTDDLETDRRIEAKYGMNTIPSDEVLAEKERADREAFRERISSAVVEEEDIPEGFTPVISAAKPPETEKKSAEELTERMGGLLRIGIGGEDIHVHDEDIKGRYYSDKFRFSPFDAEKHIALRKAYIEGLVWTLKYYYEGCVSWEWYYPFHYGPMLSDLVGIEAMLEETSFEDMGEPLRPFEQLMACMYVAEFYSSRSLTCPFIYDRPPSFSEVLPEPYREFMTSSSSPIADFYPLAFTIDMNGKRWPWEAVVLLPFIDSRRLLEVSRSVDQSKLTKDELSRNQFGDTIVFQRDESTNVKLEGVGEGQMFSDLPNCKARTLKFAETPLCETFNGESPVLKPKLLPGVEVPLPAFPTLRDGSVVSLWRKLLRINVHGTRSRYKTACLEIENPIPEKLLPLETIASQLIGKLIWINYPHFIQAFVTAVSDNQGFIRGTKIERKHWGTDARTERKRRVTKVVDRFVFGEQMVGTGGIGLIDGEEGMDELEVLLNVRPFSGFRKLPNGTTGKVFAKFEVEVPLFVTGWTPMKKDKRLANFPVLLEKDPYNMGHTVASEWRPHSENQVHFRNLTTGGQSTTTRIPKIQMRSFHSFAQVSPTNAGIVAPFQTISLTSCRTPLPLGQGTTSLLSKTKLDQRSIVAPVRKGLRPVCFTPTRRPSASFFSKRLSIVSMGAVLLATLYSGVSASSLLNEVKSIWSPSDSDNRINQLWESKETAEDQKPAPLKHSHGTTTLSFTFQGGIIVAADSRASLGSFIGSKTTQKVLPINSHVLGTMAGGAADLLFWIRVIRSEASLHSYEEGRRMSVARASRLLANTLYEYRGMQLSIGTLISGFDETSSDKRIAQPVIYYVDSTGLHLKGDSFAVGSGSSLAIGIIDHERRFEMSESDAIALGVKAIKYATFRDAHSGGFINVYLITPEQGWKRVFTQDLESLDNGLLS